MSIKKIISLSYASLRGVWPIKHNQGLCYFGPSLCVLKRHLEVIFTISSAALINGVQRSLGSSYHDVCSCNNVKTVPR